MQSFSSRIWTRFAVFISYDDNNYTTGTLQRLNNPDYATIYLQIFEEIPD